MTAYTSWAPIRAVCKRGRGLLWLLLLMMSMTAGCTLPQLPQELPELPQLPELPTLPELPGLPTDLGQVQDLLNEFGLPDLSTLGDVPGLDALPALNAPPGALVLQGPLELGLAAGDRIAGTDISLITPGTEAARFRIAEFDATRRIADSLDFDGQWPGVQGVTYTLRLRIYRLTDRQVRAAGVHRLVIHDIQPQQASGSSTGHVLRFPHSVAADRGATFAGMTFGYRGQTDRGAEISGLAQGEYPYLKVGDSLEWQGRLRPDLPVEYRMRMLFYQEGQARLGGVALLTLPAR